VAIRVLIIVLVLAAIAAYMGTYVVRFNESAVVTTFGSADKNSVVTTPGLRAKWPYPFQKVTTYDNRLRIIQSDQETQQTADKSQLNVSSFLTWRVKDPLEFFKRFGGTGDSSAREHYKEAERILKVKLRAASAAVSQFNISELVSSSEGGSKLPQLEKAMLAALKGATDTDAALSAYGIEPVEVGVMGIGLPTETTRAVFEHMKAARDAIANAVVEQGKSEANQIRSTADNNAQRIQHFADQLAATIRSKGDTEASQFLSQMKEDPQLAVFIQNMDFYRKTWGRSMTLVLPTSLPGFDLLKPDSSKKFSTGRPPSLDVPAIMQPGGPAAAPKSTGAIEPSGSNARLAKEGQ
jgi:modulator of FtsH protease HflC